MATDDSMTASQLRMRYEQGGSAKDSELTASQLRARHNVETNSFRAGGNTLMVYSVVFIIIALAYLIKTMYA